MKKINYLIASLFIASLLTSCGPEGETAEISVTEPPVSVTQPDKTETAETSAVSRNNKPDETTIVSETSAVVSSSAAETQSETAETTAAKKNSPSPVPQNKNNNTSSERDPDNPASYSGEATAPPVHDDHGPSAPDEPEHEPEKPEEPEEDEPVPDTGDVTVNLNGSSAECSSDKVEINGSSVTVKAEGIYKIYGSLSGQLTVAAPKDAKVQIELIGVNISCDNGPAIMIESSDKVKIVSAEGSESTLSDGGSSEACIYSKDDLTLKGDGKITVNGNVKNAVYSKNTLKITGGDFEINSANNGLVGKDKVVVENGNITINSAKDGIKATNDTESGKGTASVIGGTLYINAGDDAIQAISGVTVTGCSITVKAEGKKVNCDAGSSVDEGCITKIK